MHDKYEFSISYGSKVMAKVKVDKIRTNRQVNKQICPRSINTGSYKLHFGYTNMYRLLEISPWHFWHSASFIKPNYEMYCDVLSDQTIFIGKSDRCDRFQELWIYLCVGCARGEIYSQKLTSCCTCTSCGCSKFLPAFCSNHAEMDVNMKNCSPGLVGMAK